MTSLNILKIFGFAISLTPYDLPALPSHADDIAPVKRLPGTYHSVDQDPPLEEIE